MKTIVPDLLAVETIDWALETVGNLADLLVVNLKQICGVAIAKMIGADRQKLEMIGEKTAIALAKAILAMEILEKESALVPDLIILAMVTKPVRKLPPDLAEIENALIPISMRHQSEKKTPNRQIMSTTNQ
jgi:hypothetical protein